MGIVFHPGRAEAFARSGQRVGHRRQRQARNDLRHLRSVRADGRVAVVLVGGRPGVTSRCAVYESRANMCRGRPPSNIAAFS